MIYFGKIRRYILAPHVAATCGRHVTRISAKYRVKPDCTPTRSRPPGDGLIRVRFAEGPKGTGTHQRNARKCNEIFREIWCILSRARASEIFFQHGKLVARKSMATRVSLSPQGGDPFDGRLNH